jgi:hypothetical protein
VNRADAAKVTALARRDDAAPLTPHAARAWQIALEPLDFASAAEAAAELDDEERELMTPARFADFVRRHEIRASHEEPARLTARNRFVRQPDEGARPAFNRSRYIERPALMSRSSSRPVLPIVFTRREQLVDALEDKRNLKHQKAVSGSLERRPQAHNFEIYSKRPQCPRSVVVRLDQAPTKGQEKFPRR